MKNRKLNIYILNSNIENAGKLRRFLNARFGNKVTIYIFLDTTQCLRMIHDHTDVIIINKYLYHWGSTKLYGNQLLRKIKAKNPLAEIIIESSYSSVCEEIRKQMNSKIQLSGKLAFGKNIQTFINQKTEQPVKYIIANLGLHRSIRTFLYTCAVLFITGFITLIYIM